MPYANIDHNLNRDHARCVVIEPGDGVTPRDLNLLCLVDFLKLYKDFIQYIRLLQKGNTAITLKTPQPDLIALIFKTKKINGHPVSAFLPIEQHTRTGRKHHQELQYLTCKEILTLLQDQGVITVQKHGDTSAYCSLGWPVPNPVPATFVLGWDKVKVVSGRPRPTRCNKCQRYGHSSTNCRSQQLCTRCSEPLWQSDYTASSLLCPACGGGLEITSPTCR